MSRITRLAHLSYLAAATAVALPPILHAQSATGYLEWYEGLRELRPDPSRGATVTGLTLTRDVGTFHFEAGRMHLLVPVAGRTIGAVFTGRGRFRMSAPEAVEEAQLVREYGAPTLDHPLRAAVLLFTDSTEAELAASLDWAPLEPDRDAQRELDEARDYFTDGDDWVAPDVLFPLINDGPGYFYAHASEDRGDPIIFAVDPQEFEEVSLSKRTDRGKSREVVAQFHRREDYETGRSTPPEGLDVIWITQYDIETRIEDDLDLIGRASISVQRANPDFDWIPFTLYSELEVDSVFWDGTDLPFHRPEDSASLWVDLSGTGGNGGELTVHYAGDMMDRPEGLWVVLGSHTSWFPVYEFGRAVPYRLTFHAPDDYVVTTVGRQVSRIESDDRVTTEWVTEPIRNVTFNIGEFDRLDSEVPDAPPITVLVNESAHRRLGGLVADAGGLLLAQEDMAEQVALDMRNSFRVFNELYGETTVQSFVATEIPYSHGEAYPGLVMLSWDTFQFTTSQGFDEMFRAHEVAHQWWGISVRPATYRDWWLAEGFSEFSGWWYAARARGSIGMYRRRLKETREAILERRGRAAPIGLGRRAGTSRNPEDYQLTVYHKGAWVLHMLRTMLTDPDTGDDSRFTDVMRTFYEQHRGATATTRSFQQVVEQVTGISMAWFFDQWVYGSDIPTYYFSHRYDELPDGTVRATVRVRQEEVPETFQMIVPILLDFGAEGSALVQMAVVGPETEFVLPTLPREPDRIVFNPDESVLAETRTEGWRN